MLKITDIVLHHSGTIGSDPFVSSVHLTPAKISDAHQARWNFPSKHMTRNDGKPWYAGYTIIYSPRDRTFTQTRAIGEEGAHAIGANFSSVGICIISNFMQRNGVRIDPLTPQIEEDITRFVHDLINGNKRGLFVAPGTQLSLAISRVNPHRFYQTTSCYGNSITDTHFRDLLVKYTPPVAPPSSTLTLEERNRMIQVLMQSYLALLDQLNKLLAERRSRLGRSERSCEGFLSF
jgi:hypothetical protein